MPECNDSNKTIGILLGILVGAFFAYIILKRDQTPTLSLEQMQQQKILQQQEQILQQQIQQQAQLTNWQPMDIPKVDNVKPSIIQQDPKLVQIESQSQRATSQLDQITSKIQELQNTISKLQQNNMVQQPQVLAQHQIVQHQQDMQQHVSNTIYKNKQITNFVKDKDGDIIGISTERDAKINGK